MGISIRAKLMYGATYGELSEVENIDGLLDDGDIDYASPYYDSDRDDWFVGVVMPREIVGEAEMLVAIRDAKAEFERLTDGSVGRIFVSVDVT